MTLWRIISFILILALLLGLAACQPGNWPVSTSQPDTDFSAYHPNPVSGDGFTIRTDVRIFTLYAFLNGVAGYDFELNRYAPERIALRRDMLVKLAEVDPDTVKNWQAFYKNHPASVQDYIRYTLILGAPPQFNYIYSREQVPYPELILSLDGFQHVLAEFYTQANIGSLYRDEYLGIMQEKVNSYRPEVIDRELDTVYFYLRMPRETASTFSLIIINVPFESYNVDYAVEFNDQLFMLDGPDLSPGGLNLKAYLHYILPPLIAADLAAQAEKFTPIFAANSEQELVVGQFSDTQAYVLENLVLALDHRIRLASDPENAQLRASLNTLISREVAGGLVLVADFYAALESYETDPRWEIDNFIQQMLVEYEP